MTQWGLDTLFNPAKRHMDEEKRRLQSTRSEVGDNSGGRRIDLESGKVVIRKPGDEDEDRDEAAAETGVQGRSDTKSDATKADAKADAKDTSKGRSDGKSKAAGKTEPSAAALRAAARRGRTVR